MRKSRVKKLSKFVSFYVTPEQWQRIVEDHSNTLYRTISEYLRAFIADRKVRINYRNRSFDDFMSEGVRLRKELQIITTRVGGLPEEQKLLRLLDEIKVIMTKIYEVCMQESAV